MAASSKTDDRSPPSGGNGAPSARRCPRCGGGIAPRQRRFANPFGNPFLSKAPTQLTCVDCGLDSDQRPDSGRDPWVKEE